MSADYRRCAMVVWEEYRQERLDERRIQEHSEQRITYRDKTMQYHVVKQGDKPQEGLLSKKLKDSY
jgi:hypothetical protein